jgi:hypothetical protein
MLKFLKKMFIRKKEYYLLMRNMDPQLGPEHLCWGNYVDRNDAALDGIQWQNTYQDTLVFVGVRENIPDDYVYVS